MSEMKFVCRYAEPGAGVGKALISFPFSLCAVTGMTAFEKRVDRSKQIAPFAIKMASSRRFLFRKSPLSTSVLLLCLNAACLWLLVPGVGGTKHGQRHEQLGNDQRCESFSLHGVVSVLGVPY